jgi:hypothetical protein
MNYDWELELESNTETLGMANTRSPDVHPWGFFSGMSFVLANAGTFQWFLSPHEMLVWMQKAEPLVYSESGAAEVDHAGTVQKAINAFEENNGILTDVIFQMAAESLEDQRNIVWWGEFSDLLVGGSEFVIELRADFRDSFSEGDNPSGEKPINKEEKAEFIEFLSTYGV